MIRVYTYDFIEEVTEYVGEESSDATPHLGERRGQYLEGGWINLCTVVI